jgi:Cu/Ag efflux protein CusF
MKNLVMCLILMTGILVSPLVAFSTGAEMIENVENASLELSGEVISVDIENQQVVVEYQLGHREVMTSAVLNFSDAMEIYKNGEVVSTSELKEGDKVVVTYQVDDNGSKVISEITVVN